MLQCYYITLLNTIILDVKKDVLKITIINFHQNFFQYSYLIKIR